MSSGRVDVSYQALDEWNERRRWMIRRMMDIVGTDRREMIWKVGLVWIWFWICVESIC